MTRELLNLKTCKILLIDFVLFKEKERKMIVQLIFIRALEVYCFLMWNIISLINRQWNLFEINCPLRIESSISQLGLLQRLFQKYWTFDRI